MIFLNITVFCLDKIKAALIRIRPFFQKFKYAVKIHVLMT